MILRTSNVLFFSNVFSSSQHTLSLTGGETNSVSPNSFVDSIEKDLNIPLLEQQLSTGSKTVSTTNRALHGIDCIGVKKKDTYSKDPAEYQVSQYHSKLPRPQIMQRNLDLSRASLMNSVSPMKTGFLPFSSSAFSSPKMQGRILSNGSSPVPSMGTSDCSTLGASDCSEESFYPQCKEMYSPKSPNFHVCGQVHYRNDIPQSSSQYGIPKHPYFRPIREPYQQPPPLPLKKTNTLTSSLTSSKKVQQETYSPQLPRKESDASFESNRSLPNNIKNDECATRPSSCSSPLPQNLKGDPYRQAKVKTELCLYYARGKECPFGPRCNYAHGDDELKYKKLFELQHAGLVEDVNSYRSFPCVSWVATGAW